MGENCFESKCEGNQKKTLLCEMMHFIRLDFRVLIAQYRKKILRELEHHNTGLNMQ